MLSRRRRLFAEIARLSGAGRIPLLVHAGERCGPGADMAIRDDEQQALDEIERQLVAQDPWLAREFSRSRTGMDRLVLATQAIVMFWVGLIFIVVSAEGASSLGTAVGALVLACVPMWIGRRSARLRRR
jgi:hypothetical protein